MALSQRCNFLSFFILMETCNFQPILFADFSVADKNFMAKTGGMLLRCPSSFKYKSLLENLSLSLSLSYLHRTHWLCTVSLMFSILKTHPSLITNPICYATLLLQLFHLILLSFSTTFSPHPFTCNALLVLLSLPIKFLPFSCRF